MNRGFSYIETLIALAIFSIALLSLLPLFSQAQRNGAYSREAYAVQLHAQGIMAVAREAAVNGEDIEGSVNEYIAGINNLPDEFGVWYGDYAYTSGLFDFTPTISLTGLSGEIITVVCRDGNIYGRAAGYIPRSALVFAPEPAPVINADD